MTTTVRVTSEGDELRFRGIPGTKDTDYYEIEVLGKFNVDAVGEEVVDEALDDAVDTFEHVQHGDHNHIFFVKSAVSESHEYAAEVARHVSSVARDIVERERNELDARAFDKAMESQTNRE